MLSVFNMLFTLVILIGYARTYGKKNESSKDSSTDISLAKKNHKSHMTSLNEPTIRGRVNSSNIHLLPQNSDALIPRSIYTGQKSLNYERNNLMNSISSIDRLDLGALLMETTNRKISEHRLASPNVNKRGSKPFFRTNEEEINSNTRKLLINLSSRRQTAANPFKRSSSNNFQKESFDTLLSFFRGSSSKNPVQMFSNNDRCRTETSASPNKKPDETMAHSNFVGNKKTKPDESTDEEQEDEGEHGYYVKRYNPLVVKRSVPTLNQLKVDDLNQEDSNKANNTKICIEDIISDIFIASETHFSSEILNNDLAKVMGKKKEEYWKNIILEYQPTVMEISLIDILDLSVKQHFKIEFITPHGVANKIDEITKETSTLKNEAMHLLIYFHRKNEPQKSLFLSKYFFYFAKNTHFQQELRSEKDVVALYLLMLTLLQTKRSLENDPLKKISVDTIKEKAMEIFKGSEFPSKQILERLRPKINNYTIIQKTYFNLNHTGTVMSTYIFSVKSYIASQSPKLMISNNDSNLQNPTKNIFLLKKPNKPRKDNPYYIQRISTLSLGPARKETHRFIRQKSDQHMGLTVVKHTPLTKRGKELSCDSIEKGRVKTAKPSERVRIAIPSRMGFNSNHRGDNNYSKGEADGRPCDIMISREEVSKLDPYSKIMQESLTPWADTSRSQAFELTPQSTFNTKFL